MKRGAKSSHKKPFISKTNKRRFDDGKIRLNKFIANSKFCKNAFQSHHENASFNSK